MRRLPRALAVGLVALGVLYGIDGSRQPTSGIGWRLLGAVRASSSADAARAVPDDAALEAQWHQLYVHGSPPSVDWSHVVVYRFTAIGSIACPSRLDGLEINAEQRLVRPHFSRAITLGCDPARVPDAFIVAIDRDRLPAGWTIAAAAGQ